MATWRRGASTIPLLSKPHRPRRSAGRTSGGLPEARLKLEPHSPAVRTSTTRTPGTACKQLLDRAVAAQIFAALAIEAARGIEQQRLALAQSRGASLDHGFHLFAGAPTIAGHVRDSRARARRARK